MIFCVEDDDNIRELVVYTLETAGLKACGFPEGTAFMEALASELPDLVLMDVMLPGEDGMELLRKLKRTERTRDIPVIMVTGEPDNELEKQAFALGAADIIYKPFDPDVVYGFASKYIQ